MKKLVGVIAALLLMGSLAAGDGDNVFQLATTDLSNDALFADSSHDEYQRSMIVGSDLDQDGLKEIIITDYKTVDANHHGRIIVFEVTGDNTLQQVWEYDLPSNEYWTNIRTVAIGDLDGNGRQEIIAGVTGNPGDTLSAHVGVWVFEWDGVSGSNNYQLVAQITDFATYRDSTGSVIYPDRFRCEDIAVGDFDNDGKDEVLWVNNASTAFDNAYIFSIDGEFSTGFYSTVVETVFRRTDLGYGGSTVAGYGPVDLDNDGNPEGIIAIWNNVGVQIFESDAPDHYELKFHEEGLDPEDRYPYAKAVGVYDLNGDGLKELVIGALLRSRVHILEPYNGDVDSMIHYLPEWTVIDSSQDTSGNWTYDTTGMFAIYGMRVGDPDHGPGIDNGDIVLSDLNKHIYDIEYNGGDFGDTASYTVYDIYNVFPSDTFIYTYQDTAGYTVTDTVISNFYPGPTLALGNDLDGDGAKEILYGTYVGIRPPDTFSIQTGFLNVLEFSGVGVSEGWRIVGKPQVTLFQNSPNPFINHTSIKFAVKRAGNVELSVFDLSGRKVKTLVNGRFDAGTYTVGWNGRSENGEALPAGVYFYTIKYNGTVQATMKLVLSK